MVFNTNLAFKLIAFAYGDYEENGEKFQTTGIKSVHFNKSILLYTYTRIWILIAIYNIVRYLILASLSATEISVWEFYLCDFCSAIKGKPRRLLTLDAPIFQIWLLVVMLHFQKINYSKKDRFWLRFFQIPIQRTPDQLQLEGYSVEKVKRFWLYSSSLQDLILKSLFSNVTFTMSLASLSYFFMMQKYSYLHTPIVFNAILITNCVSFVYIGIMNTLVTLGPILYLYLNCKILIERFELVTNELEQLVNSKFNSRKIEKHLHEFNLIIDDLQRSKFIAWNYHLAFIGCSILFLCSLYADDLLMIGFSSMMFIMNYTPCLFICFYVCGQVHKTISLAYHPLTRICVNKNVKPITNIRIQRILNFINSEYSGFRCSSLFLIRKGVTVEIFFSVVANTILLYEMIFFIFDF